MWVACIIQVQSLGCCDWQQPPVECRVGDRPGFASVEWVTWPRMLPLADGAHLGNQHASQGRKPTHIAPCQQPCCIPLDFFLNPASFSFWDLMSVQSELVWLQAKWPWNHQLRGRGNWGTKPLTDMIFAIRVSHQPSMLACACCVSFKNRPPWIRKANV